jgi:XRE family transcriptional regulator, regulator of sulfur utilization
MDIGSVLKDLRLAKKVRQGVAADGIGISQTYLSQLEANKREATPETMRSIAKYYGVSIVYIAFFSLQENDIPKNKRSIFRELAPPVKNLLLSIKG